MDFQEGENWLHANFISTSIKEKVLVKESEVDVVLRRCVKEKRGEVDCVTSMC